MKGLCKVFREIDPKIVEKYYGILEKRPLNTCPGNQEIDLWSSAGFFGGVRCSESLGCLAHFTAMARAAYRFQGEGRSEGQGCFQDWASLAG